jgi:transmembrane sensor
VITTDLARRQASRWFERLHFHEVDDATDAEFRRWLELHPLNEREFERCELAWQFADELESDPDVVQQLNAIETRIAARSGMLLRNRFVGAGVTGLAAGIVALAVLLFASPGEPNKTSFATRVGEIRRIHLADGSAAVLNTDSKIVIEYDNDARRIWLQRGEATFDVTHEPARPFEVHVTGGIAAALGTRFNVHLKDKYAEVVVLEGRVRVRGDQGQGDLLLKPGEGASLVAGAATAFAGVEELERIEAWNHGRIEFNDVPLEVAVAELNRYSGTKLKINPGQLATMHVTGVFKVGRQTEFADALHTAFGVRVVPQGQELLLLPGEPTISAAN